MTTRKPLIAPGGFIATALVGVLMSVFRALSAKTRTAIALGLARLAWALGIRCRVTLDNLAHAFPEKSQDERRSIGKRAYENMARCALEAVCGDLVPDAQLEARVQTVNFEGLESQLRSGQGALMASAHLGSWELFGELMARRGVRYSAVVRPLAGAFNARIVKARQKSGVGLILQRGALAGMLSTLARGEAVVQLIDQVLPAKDGVFVPFFGRPASTTPAISMVALRTGKPVYVVLSVREGDNLKMYVEGPVPLPEGGDRRQVVAEHTARLTQIIESYIRRYPDQWLWLHRRWKVQPP